MVDFHMITYAEIINATKDSNDFYLIESGVNYFTLPVCTENLGNKSIFMEIEYVDEEDTVNFLVEYSIDGKLFNAPMNALSFNTGGRKILVSNYLNILDDYINYLRLKFIASDVDYKIKIIVCGIEFFADRILVSTPEEEPTPSEFLLLEEGDYILLEDGGRISLE